MGEDIADLCQHGTARNRSPGEVSELADHHQNRDAEQVADQDRPRK
jgi:hypothetical protein